MQKRREEHFDENHDFFGFSDFETHFLGKFSSKFWFLSLISSRSRRNLASREERIQKFIHTAFFWPVEVGKILMHFLIVNMNELDLIRFLPYPRKIFFDKFPGSLWSYRVGCNRFFLFRMREIASVCKPVCLYFTFLFSKERRFLKRV